VDLKKRWKSLSFKVQHLRLELEEREDHLRKLEADFNQELTKVEIEDIPTEPTQPLVGPVHVPPPELAAEMPSAGPIQGPNDLKKLWRLIAVACHPDKTKNDPRMTQLYKEAESAWRTGSYDTLYRIAIELNLEPPEQSEESLAILKGISSDLEKQIQEKEQSVLWAWGGGDEQQKSMIMDVYLKLRGKKRK
jgi:hypothetical protein